MKIMSFSKLLVVSVLLHGCASHVPSDDLLGMLEQESELAKDSGAPKEKTKYVPAYVYPHTNKFGDKVSGTWIGLKASKY